MSVIPADPSYPQAFVAARQSTDLCTEISLTHGELSTTELNWSTPSQKRHNKVNCPTIEV